MVTVEHPAWCDPGCCTAAPVPDGEYRIGTHGEHRSEPVALELSLATGAVMTSVAAAPLTAWLSCSVAPWHMTTILHLGIDGVPVLSLPASAGAGPVLDALVGLVAGAEEDTDAQVAAQLAALRARAGQAW